MPNQNLLRKLLIKPGYRLLLLNAPAEFEERLMPLPVGAGLNAVSGTSPAPTYDNVHLFTQNRAQLTRYAPEAINALKPEGIFWVSYPKKSSKVATDLTRDDGWEAVTSAGFRGIAQVSIDEVLSAVRFRPHQQQSDQDLISAQFSGSKASLLPLYENLIAAAASYGTDVVIAPRKSYISLQRRRSFALIKAGTRDRLDLGLKLPAYAATERLQDAGGFGSGSITHRVSLREVRDIDAEVLTWLRDAYDAAG